MSSESQAIELSDVLVSRRVRNGFIVSEVGRGRVEVLGPVVAEHVAFDAVGLAELAEAWAGGTAAVQGVSVPSLVSAAKDVLIAYGKMSRPKGAGSAQLDASIIALGRVIGFEDHRPEKGPDYGAGESTVPSPESGGEAASDG